MSLHCLQADVVTREAMACSIDVGSHAVLPAGSLGPQGGSARAVMDSGSEACACMVSEALAMIRKALGSPLNVTRLAVGAAFDPQGCMSGMRSIQSFFGAERPAVDGIAAASLPVQACPGQQNVAAVQTCQADGEVLAVSPEAGLAESLTHSLAATGPGSEPTTGLAEGPQLGRVPGGLEEQGQPGLAAVKGAAASPTPVQKRSEQRLRQTWSCNLCTFAGNAQLNLRCEVCQNVRGSMPDSLLSNAAESSSSQASKRVAGGSASQAGRNNRAAMPQPRHQLNSKEAAISWKQPSAHSAKRSKGMHSSNSVWKQQDACSNRWQCAQCLEWVPTNSKSEHEDFHLALALEHST